MPPGSQKLIVAKDYADCLTEFGIESDGLDLTATVTEEDDLAVDELFDGSGEQV